MELVRPSLQYLPDYRCALEHGWSPDNIRGIAAAQDELAEIDKDARAFVERQVDPQAKGPPVVLPDGSTAPRLPGYRLWMWDGEFCGSIGFRWQPGTSALPPHVLGHIGYAVVPWKRGRGYATAALKLMLAHAQKEGLTYVEITMDEENIPSRKVVLANGGMLIEQFQKPPQYGSKASLRFRIPL